MPKTIYWVRHGESVHNATGLIAGSEIESELTALGKQQAKEAGTKLARNKIDIVLASPLKRTKQTAHIVARQIGYDTKAIVYNQLLIEREAGPYSGKSRQEFIEHIKSKTLLPGSESDEALWQRAQAIMEWLKTFEAGSIVIVSHGGIGRMVKVVVADLPPTRLLAVDRINNAEIFEFSLD
jgi:broad specificity phosphatase PhoE